MITDTPISNGREHISQAFLTELLIWETCDETFPLPPLPLNSAPEANAGGEEEKVAARDGRPSTEWCSKSMAG